MWTYLATETVSAALKFVEVLARLASTHTPSWSAVTAEKNNINCQGFMMKGRVPTHCEKKKNTVI